MRTLELHFALDSIHRGKGQSAIAASAYRSAEKLVNEYTGDIHDYTRKSGVEHTEVFTPDNAPEWANNRGELWNQVEQKEKRDNAQLAYEFDIALPVELDKEQRIALGQRIGQELAQRYNTAVDIAWHEPHKDGDERNYHAHVMFPTRGFDEERADGWAKTKYRNLSKDTAKDDNGEFILNDEGKKQIRSVVEIKALRETFAGFMNDQAEREGHAVKVEHLSFEERGIDREAQKHVGVHATALHRKGEHSERYQENEEIKERNRLAVIAEKARDAVWSGFKKAANWVRDEYNNLTSFQREELHASLEPQQPQIFYEPEKDRSNDFANDYGFER